ncbi:FixH family protein [Neobacillus sp. PS2-9]|uniref:FixH family protein n=1 Tax=Neobacillus sp. PS2-9 TaxID=3070676 RepID=UPI0027DF72B2|nr:FixH family protein [Neobacillus sp. PS2-9]WML60088.1 FixH family protein [Neobacillus sp. PS2-9]
MKKLVLVFISVLVLSLMASCSNQDENHSEQPQMLDVDLTVNPEKGEINEPITFNAKVTQGKEMVNDADDVIFEIWRSKDEKHEKVEIKNPKDGVYSLEKAFQQEGTYYIISHVTARDMHNMPKKEFIVGTPSEPEDADVKDSMDGMEMDQKEKKDHN